MAKAQVKKAWGKPNEIFKNGDYSTWTYDWHNNIHFGMVGYTELSEYKHNFDSY